jgi:hypothetical protein
MVPILEGAGLTGGEEPVPVLCGPKVSPLALAAWRRRGVVPLLFRNGHSQIKDRMARRAVPAGVEESGHFYHLLRREGVTAVLENSLLTLLLFARGWRDEPDLPCRLRALQGDSCTTGEFNYRFADDGRRDAALARVVDRFAARGASTRTTSDAGEDLGGTILSHQVDLEGGRVALGPGWFRGYLRVATNEAGVVRSYFTGANRALLAQIEAEARQILGAEHGGRVVD